MSFLKCSYCGTRMHGAVYYVYWFAPPRDGGRFSYRQRLCTDCFAINVEALLTPDDVEDLTCSACGISVEMDVYPLYATWATKGTDKTRGQMALCEEHQLELKVRASKDALELPERYLDARDLAAIAPVSAGATFQAVGRTDPGVKHGANRR